MNKLRLLLRWVPVQLGEGGLTLKDIILTMLVSAG